MIVVRFAYAKKSLFKIASLVAYATNYGGSVCVAYYLTKTCISQHNVESVAR